MASGIHTVSPQKNMNLINEPLLYSTLSKDEFSLHNFFHIESREYHYDDGPVVYGSTNNSHTEIPLNISLLPHQAIVACNSIMTVKDLEQCVTLKSGTNSAQDYESDGSSTSSKGTSDSKGMATCLVYHMCELSLVGTKSKHLTKTANDQNKFCHQPCLYQPNLYRPNTSFNKNSKYYFHGGQRTRFLKNSESAERKVHGLLRRFKLRAYKLNVDPNPQILLNGGPWDPLNQSIWDVFINKIQKKGTYMNKLNLWKTIFVLFKVCLGNYGLYLVGSTMSGFALEGSDIDICLLTKPFSNEPRVDSLHHLNFLQHELLENGLASEAELVMAKVPILKFKNKETGFEVDLNCNNLVGIQNTRLLYCYAQLDWRVRPLVVIVKIWAQANNINDAKNMTVSSYSWTLMVIHYLQCGVFPPVLPCLHSLYPEEFSSRESRAMDVQGEIYGLKEYKSENKRCLGDLLIGFFHYYSYFNYEHYAISVRTGSRVPIEMCKQVKSPKNDPHQWKFLCIEEPFDLSNTARSVFDLEIFKHIKQIIVASYKELACNKKLNHILPVMQLNGQR